MPLEVSCSPSRYTSPVTSAGITSDDVRARLATSVTALDPSSWVALVPRWRPDEDVDALIADLPLRAELLRILGREIPTPRRTSWHGDPHARYAYSGRTFAPSPWTPALSSVRDALALTTGVRFDAVLVNDYRDGRDSMGYHADDEPELGPASPHDVLVASVSFGAPRRFLMRSKKGHAKHSWTLGDGDLFVMGGATQHHFVHAVPKTARPVARRVNLTFRLVRSTSAA